ncbi:hypothetical protein Clow_01431 [Corynebacterium lowii]|uniref:SGNH hydrolase-type esterase domain-containing protein n=2 Tax=Corynebacterium lowii TaxID=1544413 RepID=A0A0Q0YHG9_9CORY|nr:GDSL-type esterase/lipase family protein [Corynebacterium lowii]KQB86078.1 hypothetical protein Clow_01431 [Corynebacterium lowii]
MKRRVSIALATACAVAGMSLAGGGTALAQENQPPADVAQFLGEVAKAPVPIPQPKVAAPAPVNQDVQESYVSFGDSVAANPTVLDIMVTRAKNQGLDIQWPTIRDGFCAQGANNFPTQVAQKTGLRLEDYSCGGATAYMEENPKSAIPHDTINDQVSKALASGALDGRTKLVSISIGVNDLWQPGNYENVGQERRNALYHENVTRALNCIKEAAPNAKVVMLGLPDQTDGANHTCGTNLLGMVSHWYFPIVSYYQDELRNAQRAAAQAGGASYLDMVSEINLANNNNGCSPNPDRLSAAIFDDAPHNFTFHLTDAGHAYYANRLVQEYNA